MARAAGSGSTAGSPTRSIADQLEDAFRGCDAVLHLATGDPRVIVGSVRPVHEAASRAGIRRIVYMSSASVHGQAPDPGTDEETPLHRRHAHRLQQREGRGGARVEATPAARRTGGRRAASRDCLRPSVALGRLVRGGAAREAARTSSTAAAGSATRSTSTTCCTPSGSRSLCPQAAGETFLRRRSRARDVARVLRADRARARHRSGDDPHARSRPGFPAGGPRSAVGP